MATKTIKILNNGTTENWVNKNEMDYIPYVEKKVDPTKNHCICGRKSFTYTIQHRETLETYRLGTKCIVKAFTGNIDLRKIGHITCGCGKVVSQENLKKHIQTKYHINHLPKECSKCHKKVIPFDVDVNVCLECTEAHKKKAKGVVQRGSKGTEPSYIKDINVYKSRCKGCYRPSTSYSDYCKSCTRLKMDMCPLCNDFKEKRYELCGPCFGRTQRNKNKLKTEYCFIYDSDVDDDPLEYGVTG